MCSSFREVYLLLAASTISTYAAEVRTSDAWNHLIIITNTNQPQVCLGSTYYKALSAYIYRQVKAVSSDGRKDRTEANGSFENSCPEEPSRGASNQNI